MRDITVAGAKSRLDKYKKWKVGDMILGFFLTLLIRFIRNILASDLDPRGKKQTITFFLLITDQY